MIGNKTYVVILLVLIFALVMWYACLPVDTQGTVTSFVTALTALITAISVLTKTLK